MKKTQIFLFCSLLLGVLASCSTKVDLYADYKDVPVVYGLIDVTQDTNYVKIIRAFSGSDEVSIDASQVALIADSCNYPGKLDARLIEYKSTVGTQYNATGRVIVLDTMTINDKQPGTFYYPNQKVYFTTEKFNIDNASTKYKYELVAVTPHDTVTAETNLVGGDRFKIITTTMTFSPTGQDKTGKVSFIPAENAAVYEVMLTFNYKEKKMNEAMTDKHVSWSYAGLRPDTDNLTYEEGRYYVKYNQAILFNMLGSAIGADTLNVERYIGTFEISVVAGGRELNNYVQINSPSEGFSQTIPDYTNINGGYGVFSSRINLNATAALSAKTQTDLIGMNWGFKQR